MQLHIAKRYALNLIRKKIGEGRFRAISARYQQFATALSKKPHDPFLEGTGPLEVTVHLGGGFGAILRDILMLHQFFNAKGIDATLKIRSRFYGGDAETDMIDLYFDRVGYPDHDGKANGKNRRQITIKDPWAIESLHGSYDRNFPLADARALFHTHYRIRSTTEAEITKSLHDMNVTSQCLLGLHYRGTDKQTEAPRTPYLEFLLNTQSILRHHPDIDGVLILTDEAEFIDEARRAITSVPIYCVMPPTPSVPGIPLHADSRSPLSKGQEALEAILMLARCRYMLKTPSFLSSWAGIFSPDLVVFMPIKPNPESFVFPEREIFEAARPIPDML